MNYVDRGSFGMDRAEKSPERAGLMQQGLEGHSGELAKLKSLKALGARLSRGFSGERRHFAATVLPFCCH
ncbi:hypothetical protein IC615_00965 [Serratia ureilytica]